MYGKFGRKKLNRRWKRKSVQIVAKTLCFGGVNADGARGKIGTIKKAVRDSGASVWMMQETKCTVEGKINLDGFVTYEHLRGRWSGTMCKERTKSSFYKGRG